MSIIEGTNRVGVGRGGRPKTAVAEYDFAVEGGVVGAIALRSDTIPAGAVISDSLIHVQTKVEGGEDATLLLSVESEGDLQASKKATEAPWSTATPKRGAVTATGTPVVTTADRKIVAKVGTAALTKGKFKAIVTYLEIA